MSCVNPKSWSEDRGIQEISNFGTLYLTRFKTTSTFYISLARYQNVEGFLNLITYLVPCSISSVNLIWFWFSGQQWFRAFTADPETPLETLRHHSKPWDTTQNPETPLKTLKHHSKPWDITQNPEKHSKPWDTRSCIFILAFQNIIYCGFFSDFHY